MVQVGGRSSRDESTLSLLLEHWQLWLLLCFNLVMMDMNQVFLAFLLVQTSSGCGYHEEAGPFVQSQTLTLAAVLLWRPVAGFLTDRLPRYNHILLLGSVILETLGLLTMLLLILLPRSTSNGDAALSPWPILAISVAKQCLEVQLNNSIFKIFKLRLQNHCGLATCDTQCHVISAVGICSELLELVVNLVTCVAAYLLIMAGASFESVKSCYFASTLVASIVCIALAADICRQSPRYYVHVEVDAGEASGTTRGQLQSTLLDGIAATSFSEAASPAAQETSRASSRPANWMQRAIRGVCCEPIALGSITLMLWLYSSQEVLYNVRSLSIPGRHVNNSATPTASNFCAGYLTNMVYQDIWENACYFIAALLYVMVLKRMRPLPFVRWLLPSLMAALIGVTAVITLPGFGQMALALSLETVVAVEYVLSLYLKYLSIAAIASAYYGFYSFTTGAIQSCIDLAIYGAMQMRVTDTALNIVMYGCMAICLIGSAAFSVARRNALQLAGGKACS